MVLTEFISKFNDNQFVFEYNGILYNKKAFLKLIKNEYDFLNIFNIRKIELVSNDDYKRSSVVCIRSLEVME